MRRRKAAKVRRTKLKLLALYYSIRAYNSCRRRSKLTRKAVVDVDQSPWKKLLRDGSDNDFLCITGFDKQKKRSLLLQ